MKLRRALPLLAGLGLLALQARGDAPIAQYESFDKAQLFIIDLKTHLRWQRFVSGTPETNVADAETYCKNLTAILGPGSRLPTVKELLTLVDEEPHEEFVENTASLRYIDRNAFAGAPTKLPYITLGDNLKNPWVVYFNSGIAERPTQTPSGFYVRCVKAE